MAQDGAGSMAGNRTRDLCLTKAALFRLSYHGTGDGARARLRTADLRLTRAPLYQLSYRGVKRCARQVDCQKWSLALPTALPPPDEQDRRTGLEPATQALCIPTGHSSIRGGTGAAQLNARVARRGPAWGWKCTSDKKGSRQRVSVESRCSPEVAFECAAPNLLFGSRKWCDQASGGCALPWVQRAHRAVQKDLQARQEKLQTTGQHQKQM